MVAEVDSALLSKVIWCRGCLYQVIFEAIAVSNLGKVQRDEDSLDMVER